MNNNYTYGVEDRPNIFKQFAFSFVPPKYDSLVNIKVGVMIGFIALFAFLLNFISFLELLTQPLFNGSLTEYLESVPNFELANGQLSIDEDYIIADKSVKVFILATETVEEFDKDDVRQALNEGYTTILLLSKTNICGYSNGEFTGPAPYAIFGKSSYSKNWIMKTLIPSIKLIVIGFQILTYIFTVIGYFISAAVYMLIAMLIALIEKKRIPVKNLYRTAFYSKFPVFFVSCVFNLIPISFIRLPIIVRIILNIVFLIFTVRFSEESAPTKFRMVSGVVNENDFPDDFSDFEPPKSSFQGGEALKDDFPEFNIPEDNYADYNKPDDNNFM